MMCASMDQDFLTPTAILDNLGTTALPRSVRCYAEVSSTMDVAREALEHAPPTAFPLLVLADSQTAGRGRLQRSWVAPPGSALLFSLALRPDWLPPARAHTLIWMTGVALCAGIAAATGLQPRLKWPNDVLLPLVPDTARAASASPAQTASQPESAPAGWGKVAGILLEMSSTANAIERAIIGCGLNVSAHPSGEMPLRYPATNLAAALGRPVERLALLRALLKHLDHWYTRLQCAEFDHLFATWRGLLLTLGHEVHIQTDTGPLVGYAEDVEPSGALRLRDAAGRIHVISSGDVGAS